MKDKPSPCSTASLVASKLAESLITSKEAGRLGLRPLDATAIGKLPNMPAGPHNPGLLILYFGLDGKPLFVTDCETNAEVHMYRVRYLPPLRINGLGREQKYTQPKRVSSPPYLAKGLADWVALAANPKEELWITEGELKSITATKFGQPTIGLGGVWNFGGHERPLADVFYEFEFEDRRVVCVYDSDYVTNHNVRYACDRLARALVNQGADVRTLVIPSLVGRNKVGLDDYLKLGARTPKEALCLLRDHVMPWEDGTMNDSGNANIFVQLHSEGLFYAREERAWRLWDGKLWMPNRDIEALGLTEAVSAQLHSEASTLQDEQIRKQAYRWAKASGNEGKRRAMLALAQTKLVKNVDCLDADPLLFNCQNGILDLNKFPFRLLPANPRLLQGRISPVAYDKSACCPEFDRFLVKIVPN